nr:AMP-binding protein [Leucobacter exalbidus]
MRAQATGDTAAVTDEHGASITFAELLAKSERVAAGLYGAGITPGAVVSWQLPTRIDAIVLSMALARLGAVQNPIIPLYRKREVASMVEQCGSQWLITIPEFRGFDHAEMAREIRESLGDKLELLILAGDLPEGDVATLPVVPGDRDAVRWIYTTSGTTSAPKGVCHTDGTLIAGGVSLAESLEATAKDVGTIAFPFAHIGGPDMLIASFASGMPLVTLEVYEPNAAVELMNRTGVTITGGSTPHYSMLLDMQRKNPDTPVVPTLRVLAGGGAPMSEQLFNDVLTEIGVPVLHAFGMTECPMITAARVGDTLEQLAATSGGPVLGAEVQIRSEEDEVLAAGEVGRVWLRGPMRFKHYLVEGEIVRPFDEGGWMFTGDLGKLRDDGYLVLVGREKDLIIRKGESISPAEIEEVIATHPDVVDVAVIGLPDERAGERICAVVVLGENAAEIEVSDMRDYCKESGISPAKFPQEIVFVPEMPKTPTMKIRKQHLRQSIIDRIAADSATSVHEMSSY